MLDRAMDIDREYRDVGLGLVDASIVADRGAGVYRLATRDVRHFTAVRLRGGKRFDLVVQPERPDRGA